MKRSIPVAMAVGLMLAVPLAAQAQMSMAEAQVSDLETMQGKFAGLAEAFPEDSYDWQPMEGVRSVKQVMALAAAEGNLFPMYLGMEKAPAAAESFGDEMGRLMGMSKAQIVDEINRAFEHFIAQVEALDDAGRMEAVNFFGQDVQRGAAVTLAANDMHEHLGQAIAYARTNEIVPPWSQGDGM